MKSRKTAGIIFYCCAGAYFILAMANIFTRETRSTGVTWLCLGSTFLCLGTAFRKCEKSDGDDEDDKDTEE